MKKITKILALMLVLVMGVCMFTGCSDESKVEGIAEDFMDALADGDGEAAAELCDGKEMKSEARKTAERLEGILEYEITDVEVDGDEAIVRMEVTVEDDTDDGSIDFEKIDGDWKIVDID